MKKLFIKTLNLSPISNKNKEKISNNYTLNSNENSNKTISKIKHKKAKSNNYNFGNFQSFNYPIILTNEFKSLTSRFNKENIPISPRLTNEKIKQYFSDNDIKNNIKNENKNNKTEFLQFHHRLRLFIKREKNDNNNKNLINKITDRNAEEMFFVYDKNKNKISCFSGNNAGLLRNKVLFVKGVMDYTFSKLMIKKMNFLDNEKKKIFELKNKKNYQINNYNYIFNKKIKSSYEKINMNNKYNNIEEIKKNLIKKKFFNGKNLVIKKLNKCDFIE